MAERPDERVVYVILTNNASGDWHSSERALALHRGWLRAISPADVWLHSVNHQLYSRQLGVQSGALYFNAFRDAVRTLGPALWYMVCDDDTHVDPAALRAFVQNASAQTVYGNVYDSSHTMHCPQPNGRSARACSFQGLSCDALSTTIGTSCAGPASASHVNVRTNR